MMDKDHLLALFDREERREAAFYNCRREATPHVVRYLPLPGMAGGSFIIYSNLNAQNADDVIQAEVAHFKGLGVEFEWKVYDHDQPPDLLDRLARHGFEIEDPEALMVLDLADTPAALRQPITHDVRRITDPALIPEILKVQALVWDEQGPDRLFESVQELRLNGSHVSYYAAYADGRPVCAARVEFSKSGQFAGLWGGATLPAYRRRGFYTALVAVRAQEAIRRGYRFLTIDASPMSRPIVERHGFRFYGYSHPCKWHVKGSLTPTAAP